MEVWDDRRSEPLPRGRIRRSWMDWGRLVVELIGGGVVAGSLIFGLMTSMGFKVSGSADAIAKIDSGNVSRDSRITALETTQPTMLFMLCGLYQKQFPDQTPALCDLAISRGRARR